MENCFTMSCWLLPHTNAAAAAAAAKSLQSCLTLCNPIDSSPPGSPVHGIFQARILEWVVISFSNAQKWKVKVKSFSHVWLLATPWTAAHQAPPSLGFSRQEYWSGCHFLFQCMKVKSESEVAESCLTPRDPMDCSPPGSSIHGIFWTGGVECVAITAMLIYHSYIYVYIYPPSWASLPPIPLL